MGDNLSRFSDDKKNVRHFFLRGYITKTCPYSIKTFSKALKIENKSVKLLDISLDFAQNIDCGEAYLRKCSTQFMRKDVDCTQCMLSE